MQSQIAWSVTMAKYFLLMASYSYLLGLEVTVQTAKPTKQLSSSLFLGVMASLYWINQMKSQAQLVGGKWLNKIAVLLWMLSIVFIYFLLSQRITSKGVSKTETPPLQMHVENIWIRNLICSTSRIKTIIKWCPSDQFPVPVFPEFKRLKSKETPDPHFSSLKKKKKKKCIYLLIHTKKTKEGILLSNNHENSKLSI